MDDNKRTYRLKMYVMNFDKHPECKGAGKREEIHQKKFEKNGCTMNYSKCLYDNGIVACVGKFLWLRSRARVQIRL